MCKNILVADDDIDMRGLYKRLLSGNDYAVTLAGTFGEASCLIQGNRYDLLITDLMFPDGLGSELIRLFSGKSAAAKSLLVTGSAETEEARNCPKPFAFFEKPFKVDTFMSTVTKALSP